MTAFTFVLIVALVFCIHKIIQLKERCKFDLNQLDRLEYNRKVHSLLTGYNDEDLYNFLLNSSNEEIKNILKNESNLWYEYAQIMFHEKDEICSPITLQIFESYITDNPKSYDGKEIELYCFMTSDCELSVYPTLFNKYHQEENYHIALNPRKIVSERKIQELQAKRESSSDIWSDKIFYKTVNKLDEATKRDLLNHKFVKIQGILKIHDRTSFGYKFEIICTKIE